MRLFLSVLFLVLVACHTPSPHFYGLPVQTVMVEGSTFDVRVNGNLAEAIRTNIESPTELGRIPARAAKAIKVVSGCDVLQVSRDPNVVVGQLDCDGTGVLYVPPPPIFLSCDAYRDAQHVSSHTRYLDLDCTAY